MDMPSALLAAQDGRCFYCAVEFDGPSRPGKWRPRAWTREHLFPKSAGYALANNCVLSCAQCNRNKGSRTPGKNERARAYVVMQKAVRLAKLANGDLPEGWSFDRTVIEFPEVFAAVQLQPWQRVVIGWLLRQRGSSEGGLA